MRSTFASVLTVLALSGLSPAAARPAGSFFERSLTTNVADVADKTFDFVIVGGGLAGVVVASRLSEWSNTTVLVIEAGRDGTDVALRREVPGFSYMRGLAFGSEYGWNFTTTNQCGLDHDKPFALGRGLGGGSAVNGMFWTRPGSAEVNAWSELNGGNSWGWDDFDGYVKKAETVIPATAEQQTEFGIQYDAAAHGQSGPLKVGWANYIYSLNAKWIPTFTGLGFPSRDLAAGDNRGVAIVPLTMNPNTGSRSDSSVAYLSEDRPNLVVLTGYQVTKINFNGTAEGGNIVASGVQFQADAAGQSYSVKANKEVIVASGTVGSPKVLQLSGIGPKSVLDPLSVAVNVDLPVGYNFQDHVMVQMAFDGQPGPDTWGPLCINSTLQDIELAKWQSTHDGPLTYVNEATAYVSMADLGGSLDVDVAATVSALTSKYNLPESVQKGLTAQYNIMKGWLSSAVPQVETILNLWGNTAQGMRFEAAVQHPWSRGTVFIKSANAFDMPIIDPNFLGLDADINLLTQGINFVRKVAGSAPLSESVAAETGPGANFTGDALTAWMKEACGSEYHPIGTCPMLPRDMGGVVDTSLLVYGTANVRVIDASVAPLQVAAHTMAPAYGIAEKGADLIKAFYSGSPAPTTNGTATTANGTSQAPGSSTSKANSPSASTSTKPASGASMMSVSWAVVAGILAIPLLL